MDTINQIKFASNAEKVSLYQKLSIKYRVASLNIFFNGQCLAKKIVPKYVVLKLSPTTNAGRHAVEAAKRIWVRRELHEWYVKRDAISHYLLLLHMELTKNLHWVEWICLDDKIRQRSSEVAHTKRLNLIKKLEELCHQSHHPNANQVPTSHSFHQRVVNLSGHHFEPRVASLMDKGLNFVPSVPLSDKDYVNITMDCELILGRDSHGEKRAVAQKILKYRKENRRNRSAGDSDFLAIKSIQRTLKENNLVIQKADKGNSMVILKKDVYIDKCLKFISDNQMTIVPKDPTIAFQKHCKNVINSCEITISRQQKLKLIQMNPRAPRFFGLPKIHKQENPIRPVVSNISAPNHLIARKVNSLFRDYTKFAPKYGVINSKVLAERLAKLTIPTKCMLVSFDVNNLFTNVPCKEAVMLAEATLVKKGVAAPVISELCSMMDAYWTDPLTEAPLTSDGGAFSSSFILPMRRHAERVVISEAEAEEVEERMDNLGDLLTLPAQSVTIPEHGAIPGGSGWGVLAYLQSVIASQTCQARRLSPELINLPTLKERLQAVRRTIGTTDYDLAIRHFS
ncbi:uncharacterized protein, partial [Hetaerina americana]|uniref:uncharacterized protein n=1 Tax=Hetaerina americana TaxID=62018 RepID=UPI003A7F5EA0